MTSYKNQESEKLLFFASQSLLVHVLASLFKALTTYDRKQAKGFFSFFPKQQA